MLVFVNNRYPPRPFGKKRLAEQTPPPLISPTRTRKETESKQNDINERFDVKGVALVPMPV